MCVHVEHVNERFPFQIAVKQLSSQNTMQMICCEGWHSIRRFSAEVQSTGVHVYLRCASFLHVYSPAVAARRYAYAGAMFPST